MGFVVVAREREKSFVQAVLVNDVADNVAREAEIAHRVRVEVGRLKAEAQAEGRAAGKALRGAAQAEGAASLGSAAAALNAACAQLVAPLAGKEHDLAELVIELSFVLARHIIGVGTEADPAGLNQLVTGLIEEAAAEADPKQSIVVRLNPRDQARLVPLLRAGTAQLLADAAISPGGALVEINVADGDPVGRIEWDATIETRLEALRAALVLPETLAASAKP